MGVSAIQIQHDIILATIKDITQGDWKVLVVDETSKKIIDNVVKEDDILNQNIANIERIEERRDPNPTMDAIYFLSPQPHIVDCLLADFERRRYRRAYLVWTDLLDPQLRRRIDSSRDAVQLQAGYETLYIDFFPRESHLITFRDPWSFPILYHPACNNLVREHMQILAQKITGVCVSLGEYPKVRYYRPRNPLHEASVLSSHLARFVQEELDTYAQWNQGFPAPSSRPQGVLLITDRSMDLMAPLVHEFTYQAMAHDLLPIRDPGDKVTFHMTINENTPNAQEKDMELHERDKVWVDNRHRHMKDTIDKLMADFQKFLDQNPHFANESGETTSLNAIKDMLAGLPQFQEMKEAYSLHLTMAQECMNVFQKHKLPDIASVEQTLATGLDEDFRKPKNILEQVVRLLDDEAITPPDRLRLVTAYILYRDGVILEDVKRLLAHAGLPPQDGEIISNLELLGARITHGLKDSRPAPPPLFPRNAKTAEQSEEYALSRFEPNVKYMLEELCKGALDPAVFPYVKPPLDPNEDMLANQGSLRAAKPSWAGAGRRVADNRQRVVVFLAGGATYSESRACYEVSARHNRDVFLATSHMVSPQLFVRQLRDLSVDKRRLDLPMERPKPKAPAHLFERPAPPMPAGPAPGGPRVAPPRKPMATGGLPGAPGPRPPTQAMGQMSLGGTPRPVNGSGSIAGGGGSYNAAPADDKKSHKLEKDKKKRNIFGIKK
ncbi:Sec1 family superfamily [Pleurostoma richardsiae]|uniref:Sec1 family superfamily n=1 Tax=Pleurostoma richardsiae TaxID=41990 RepID=A0AA38RB91_9PEZI|nr:Sec1 family superfamily [Pleurostoma richardsiae]